VSDLIAVPTIGDRRWMVRLSCGHTWVHVAYLQPGDYSCGCLTCPRSPVGRIQTREVTACGYLNGMAVRD
jgi:hypothetical protein